MNQLEGDRQEPETTRSIRHLELTVLFVTIRVGFCVLGMIIVVFSAHTMKQSMEQNAEFMDASSRNNLEHKHVCGIKENGKGIPKPVPQTILLEFDEC